MNSPKFSIFRARGPHTSVRCSFFTIFKLWRVICGPRFTKRYDWLNRPASGIVTAYVLQPVSEGTEGRETTTNEISERLNNTVDLATATRLLHAHGRVPFYSTHLSARIDNSHLEI